MAAETGAAAIGAGGQIASGVLGMIGQKSREKRAMKNTRDLMDIQFRNQKELDKYGQELQMETWEKTNYPAQIAMLKEAGMNPGLLYGNGGPGGVTGSQGGGSAASGSAPAPQEWPLDIGQAAMMAAQIKLMNAQAKKTENEANVIAETGMEEAQSRIAKLIAETTNEKVKTNLNQINTDIADIEKAYKPYLLNATVSEIMARVINTNLQTDLTTDQYNDLVEEVRERARGQALKNLLTEAETDLKKAQKSFTEAEKQGIYTSLMQKWTELGFQERHLNQGADIIAIDKLEAEIRQQYPSLGQMTGNIIRNWYHAVRNIDDKMLKQERL